VSVSVRLANFRKFKKREFHVIQTDLQNEKKKNQNLMMKVMKMKDRIIQMETENELINQKLKFHFCKLR
jgi:hypothetical protein